ncbi:MAG: hypothetical protein ABDI20_08105 [Candidatus Bipolaricaulaceae bacterium]
MQQWPRALRDGRLRLVLVLGDDPLGAGAWPVPEAGEWIVASSHWTETASRAQVLLALCTHAEATGCFRKPAGGAAARPARQSPQGYGSDPRSGDGQKPPGPSRHPV